MGSPGPPKLAKLLSDRCTSWTLGGGLGVPWGVPVPPTSFLALSGAFPAQVAVPRRSKQQMSTDTDFQVARDTIFYDFGSLFVSIFVFRRLRCASRSTWIAKGQPLVFADRRNTFEGSSILQKGQKRTKIVETLLRKGFLKKLRETT